MYVTLTKLISPAGLSLKEHVNVFQIYHHLMVPDSVYFRIQQDKVMLRLI